MEIGKLIIRDVRTSSPDSTLEEAARALWEGDVGSVVVVADDGRPVAMITDRDIAMAAYTQGCCLRDISVRSAMSQRIITCKAEDSVSDVEALMQGEQVRRVWRAGEDRQGREDTRACRTLSQRRGGGESARTIARAQAYASE